MVRTFLPASSDVATVPTMVVFNACASAEAASEVCREVMEGVPQPAAW